MSSSDGDDQFIIPSGAKAKDNHTKQGKLDHLNKLRRAVFRNEGPVGERCTKYSLPALIASNIPTAILRFRFLDACTIPHALLDNQMRGNFPGFTSILLAADCEIVQRPSLLKELAKRLPALSAPLQATIDGTSLDPTRFTKRRAVLKSVLESSEDNERIVWQFLRDFFANDAMRESLEGPTCNGCFKPVPEDSRYWHGKYVFCDKCTYLPERGILHDLEVLSIYDWRVPSPKFEKSKWFTDLEVVESRAEGMRTVRTKRPGMPPEFSGRLSGWGNTTVLLRERAV